MSHTTSLSVLVPVYNEEHLVCTSLQRLDVLASSPHLSRCEVIVVDDGSRDGTPAALAAFEQRVREANGSFIDWRFIRHDVNKGKGGAIQTALAQATCEITVIHDADLEYNPADLLHIVEVFVTEEADAVFGSRFAGASVRRVLMYRHQLGNRFLTFLCNLFTNLNLTDMETCYKAVRTSLLKSIPLVSNDFRLEPELTIKLGKRQARLFEVPISYSGRTYQEGKKINWRDGLAALWAIVRFSASDNVYKADKYGSQILARLSRASRFNAWMADVVRPFCGRRILEIGAGVGNLTQHLIPRDRYVASDINPLYLETLHALAINRPYLSIRETDVTDARSFPDPQGGFDTVICLNVVEHIDDDRTAMLNIAGALAPGGRAVVLVPQGQWNYGTLDEVLGHVRRHSHASLTALADHAGLKVEQIVPFNRFGTIAWFLNGRVLRRRTFGLGQIKLLQVLMPVIRRIDRWLPLPGLSLIAILRREA